MYKLIKTVKNTISGLICLKRFVYKSKIHQKALYLHTFKRERLYNSTCNGIFVPHIYVQGKFIPVFQHETNFDGIRDLKFYFTESSKYQLVLRAVTLPPRI